jgi:hypothetical protein
MTSSPRTKRVIGRKLKIADKFDEQTRKCLLWHPVLSYRQEGKALQHRLLTSPGIDIQRYPLYTFNALTEFAEVAGILLYAENGLSSVIKSIGLAFRFLSLNVSLSNYPDFLIAFSLVSALTTLICVNAFVVGQSFWNKTFANVWSVRLLHTLVSVILEGFFLARYDVYFLTL